MSNNYNTLVSNVQQILEDDSQEFANYIPVAVKLATLRLTRESDGLINNEVNTTVSVAANNRFVSKPPGYLFSQNLVFNKKNGENIPLVKQSKSFLETYWIYGNTSATSTPKYYADYNSSSFVIAPTVSANNRLTLSYTKRPSAVSTANQTNSYTDNIPELYLYATVVEMARFARNNELLSYYEQAYVNGMLSYNNEQRRARRDEGMSPMNPNPQLNTLKQEN